MAGGWGSSKNGVRLGCFWDSIEKNADGSQARITNARIRIDRDVNIVDSSNSLSWSGGAVNDGSASNINCDGSGEKTIKTVTGQWQDLVYGATKSANFSASMSGINYAGATISNTESVTYPARAYLAPVAPTDITWTQNSPGNFTISWSNMNSTAAPWTTLVLLRTELGGATTELVLGNPTTDVANVQSGLALDKQYSWALRISNSTATVVSASTSVTPIPLHTMSLSATTVDIGNSITFNINKYGSSNTSTIYFIKNGIKTIVWDKQSATSYTYTFDKASWSIYLSNAASGSFTVGIETFSGTLSLGVNTYAVTVNVPNVSPYLPTSVIPVRTEQNSNIASAFGANVFIKNLSKIRHTWLGSPGDSASVTMREILIRESWRSTMLLMPEVSGTPGYVYDEIPAGNGTVTVSSRTTDSRGRVATSDESTFNVYNYAAPVINAFTVARCDSAGNINNSGTYVKFTINVSVSSVNPGIEANKMKYRIRLLDSNGNETGTDLYTKTLDSTLIHNITTGAIGGSYSSQSGYSFKLTLDDNLTILTGSSITRSASISSEVYPLSIGTNGIAIGKVYNDSTKALDVIGDSLLTGGLTVTGPVVMTVPSHTHDDRYYTETEMNTLLSGKQAAGSYAAAVHTHNLSDINLTQIGSGANLNSFTTQGFYAQNLNSNAASGSNYPEPIAGYLEVLISTSSFIYQRYSCYQGSGQGRVYQRACYNGTWAPWQLISGSMDAKMYKSTSGPAYSSSTWTKVISFTNTEYANGIGVDLTNGNFNINYHGIYDIEFYQRWQAYGAVYYRLGAIMKGTSAPSTSAGGGNGDGTLALSQSYTNDWYVESLSAPNIELNAGDVISFWIRSGVASTWNTTSDSLINKAPYALIRRIS